MTESQRKDLSRYARLIALELPTIELGGGSARCMIATIHVARGGCSGVVVMRNRRFVTALLPKHYKKIMLRKAWQPQWRATAFGGMQIDGITILERHASGKIVAAAIHHRPVGAVLRFSAEIRDRLAGVIPADHFLKESA